MIRREEVFEIADEVHKQYATDARVEWTLSVCPSTGAETAVL